MLNTGLGRFLYAIAKSFLGDDSFPIKSCSVLSAQKVLVSHCRDHMQSLLTAHSGVKLRCVREPRVNLPKQLLKTKLM